MDLYLVIGLFVSIFVGIYQLGCLFQYIYQLVTCKHPDIEKSNFLGLSFLPIIPFMLVEDDSNYIANIVGVIFFGIVLMIFTIFCYPTIIFLILHYAVAYIRKIKDLE